MTLTITPTGATLGATVTGVDLANLADADWADIERAFLTHAVLIVVCIIMLFPVLWVISTSFKFQEEVESSNITLFPQNFTLSNYDHILNGMVSRVRIPGEGQVEVNLFWTWVRNSVLVAGITTTIGVLLAATCAYALSRFQFSMNTCSGTEGAT